MYIRGKNVSVAPQSTTEDVVVLDVQLYKKGREVQRRAEKCRELCVKYPFEKKDVFPCRKEKQQY